MAATAALISSSCIGHCRSNSSPDPQTLSCCAHQQPWPFKQCFLTAATIEVAFAHMRG